MTQRTIKLWMLLVLHAAVGAGCGGPPTLQAPAEEVVPAKPLRIDVPDFFSARIDAGTFAPDGKTLAVSMLGGVRLWDLASGDLLDDTKKRPFPGLLGRRQTTGDHARSPTHGREVPGDQCLGRQHGAAAPQDADVSDRAVVGHRGADQPGIVLARRPGVSGQPSGNRPRLGPSDRPGTAAVAGRRGRPVLPGRQDADDRDLCRPGPSLGRGHRPAHRIRRRTTRITFAYQVCNSVPMADWWQSAIPVASASRTRPPTRHFDTSMH